MIMPEISQEEYDRLVAIEADKASEEAAARDAWVAHVPDFPQGGEKLHPDSFGDSVEATVDPSADA